MLARDIRLLLQPQGSRRRVVAESHPPRAGFWRFAQSKIESRRMHLLESEEVLQEKRGWRFPSPAFAYSFIGGFYLIGQLSLK